MKLPRRLLSTLAALVCALSLPSNEAAAQSENLRVGFLTVRTGPHGEEAHAQVFALSGGFVRRQGQGANERGESRQQPAWQFHDFSQGFEAVIMRIAGILPASI